jgi:chromosome segregation ATPase
MSEPIISFAIGFLLAILLAFVARSLVLSRVRRHAITRLETAPPKLMADIESDMGELHAQIAVATRRLEVGVEQMKAKTVSQLSEIGKTNEAIARLKLEFADRSASVQSLEAKEEVQREELRTVETAIAAKTGELEEIERRIAEEKTALAEIMSMIHARNKLAESERRNAAAMEKLKAENAALDEQLTQSRQECAKLHDGMATLRQQVEAIWASERMANAILRERITDVASEVVRVAHALEGLGSPIELMLAGKTGELSAASEPPALTAGNGSSLVPSVTTEGEDSKSALAHRLRSIQLRATRVPSSGGT